MRRGLLLISIFLLLSFVYGNIFYYGGRTTRKNVHRKIAYAFPQIDKFKRCGLIGNAGVLRVFEGQKVRIAIYEFKNEYDSFAAFSQFINVYSRFFEIYHGGFVRKNKIYVWTGKFFTISEFKNILKINSIRYLEWILKQYPHKNIPFIFDVAVNLSYPILSCKYYSNIDFVKVFGENLIFAKCIPFLHVKFKIGKRNVDFFITKKRINSISFKNSGFMLIQKEGLTFIFKNEDKKISTKIISLIIDNKNKIKKFFRRDNFTYGDIVLNGLALAFLLLFLSIVVGLIFGFIRAFLKRNKNEEKIVVLKLEKRTSNENNKKGGNS